MNSIKGKIKSVSYKGSLSFVKVEKNNVYLSAIILTSKSSRSHLEIGNNINVIFKESEVIMGIGDVSGISLQNKIPGTIMTIDSNELMSKVTLDTAIGKVRSIITSNAVKQLGLREGVKAIAMIKTNEMMLSE
jgi:molybdopterin-binding protein